MKVEGLRPKQIAVELGVGTDTVNNDLTALRRPAEEKLTRRQLAMKEIQEARGCVEAARDLLHKEGVSTVEARLLTAAAETLACIAHAGSMVSRFRAATKGREIDENGASV